MTSEPPDISPKICPTCGLPNCTRASSPNLFSELRVMTDLEFHALILQLKTLHPRDSEIGRLARASLQRLEELQRLRKVLDRIFRDGCGEDSDIAALALQESHNAFSASWGPPSP